MVVSFRLSDTQCREGIVVVGLFQLHTYTMGFIWRATDSQEGRRYGAHYNLEEELLVTVVML